MGQRRPGDLTISNVRFIPGPDQGDAAIAVLAVEVHENLIVIDIANQRIEEIGHPTARRRLPQLMIEDDLGNRYRGMPLALYGAGWSGKAPAAHFAAMFKPTPPPEARFLRITFGRMYEPNRSVVVML